jgi:hypothetical protein
MMANGLPWVGSYGKAPNPRDLYPPPAGSHDVQPAEVTNRDEDIPESRSPGPRGHSNQTTSRQGSRSQPHQGTRDADVDEWLKPWPSDGPDSGGQFFKPTRWR